MVPELTGCGDVEANSGPDLSKISLLLFAENCVQPIWWGTQILLLGPTRGFWLGKCWRFGTLRLLVLSWVSLNFLRPGDCKLWVVFD